MGKRLHKCREGDINMGYRSEVAYIIAFDAQQQMGQFIQWVMSSGDEHMINALKECEVDFSTLRINFWQSDVKWYESYADVQGHTRLLELCNLEDTPFHANIGGMLIRVGEDEVDIETTEYGNDPPYDGFYTVTNIEMPFNASYTSYGTTLEALTKPKE